LGKLLQGGGQSVRTGGNKRRVKGSSKPVSKVNGCRGDAFFQGTSENEKSVTLLGGGKNSEYTPFRG